MEKSARISLLAAFCVCLMLCLDKRAAAFTVDPPKLPGMPSPTASPPAHLVLPSPSPTADTESPNSATTGGGGNVIPSMPHPSPTLTPHRIFSAPHLLDSSGSPTSFVFLLALVVVFGFLAAVYYLSQED